MFSFIHSNHSIINELLQKKKNPGKNRNWLNVKGWIRLAMHTAMKRELLEELYY